MRPSLSATATPTWGRRRRRASPAFGWRAPANPPQSAPQPISSKPPGAPVSCWLSGRADARGAGDWRAVRASRPIIAALRHLVSVAVSKLKAGDDRRGREQALGRMLEAAVQESLLLGKGAGQIELAEGPQRFRAGPEHGPAVEVETKLLGGYAHFRRQLQHFRASLAPGRLQRGGFAGETKGARTDDPDARVGLERLNDRLGDPRASEEIEQRPSPPQRAEIRDASAIVRFLAVDLADVAIAIEPTGLQELKERPHITTAIFGHDDLGVRKVADDRADQLIASKHGGDDQVKGNAQALQDAG